MEIPDPEPGLVIRYAYLWRSEHMRGLEEGRKDRPCAIVLAVAKDEGETRVAVAAITHSPPQGDTIAISVPPLTSKRLGLDDEPKWIVISEVNIFTWPGPDLRPVSGRQPKTIAYGILPERLTSQLINQARENLQRRQTRVVERDT